MRKGKSETCVRAARHTRHLPTCSPIFLANAKCKRDERRDRGPDGLECELEEGLMVEARRVAMTRCVYSRSLITQV